MFDGEAFFTPLKNKFQTMHVTLKNKQHQELRDCIVKVIAEGVDIVQSFQLLSKYTLIPHQELQLQPFVIKTSDAPLQFRVEVVHQNKVIFQQVEEVKMTQSESQSQEDAFIA